MTEPIWLTAAQVTIFNQKLVAAFGGLAGGLRSGDLLESALARPQQKFHYKKSGASLFTLAASLAFALAKAHAFTDGNKRTAYLSAIVFLKLNGVICAPPQAEIVEKMVQLASGEIDELGFGGWLKNNERGGK